MPDHPFVRAADRWHRWLLWIYPRSFRRRMGPGLLATHRDRCRDEWHAKGWMGLGTYWVRSTVSFAKDGVLERVATRTPGGARRPDGAFRGIARDARFALRAYVKQPAFFFLTLVTVALGIGSTTTIYSVVDGVLLRPLPYPDADRLVQVGMVFPGFDRLGGISHPNFLHWRAQPTAFSALAAARWTDLDLSGDGEPERLAGAGVTADFFEVLGSRPLLGRAFTETETRTEASRVVVLSHRLWQRRWGGDPAMLGRTITLNTERYTIVGVMPPDFRGPEAFNMHITDAWVPLLVSVIGRDYAARDRGFFTVIARLHAGASLTEAQAAVDAMTVGNRVVPLDQQTVGDIGGTLGVLLGAVGLLLLIACANVANLFLARAADRRREMAVRTALGASTGQILRQLLTESVLLTTLGGLLGLGLAYAGVRAFMGLGPDDLPRMAEIGVNIHVLGVAMGLSVVTGLVVGLAPAYHASRIDTNEVIKEAAPSGGRSRNRLRGALVITEIGLALVLLVGAGLLINSFVRLRNVDPGFDAAGVTIVKMYEGLGFGGTAADGLALRRELTDRVRALPGVGSVAFSLSVPLTGDGSKGSVPIVIDGRPDEPVDAGFFTWVSPGFFPTLGIGMQPGGRDFAQHDLTANAPVVIVNETFARRAWPDGGAVGKRITLPGRSPDWATVVGVVDDVRQDRLDTPSAPGLYFVDRAGVIGPPLYMVVKADGGVSLAAQLRDVIHAIDPDRPIASIHTMDAQVAQSIVGPRFYMLLLGSFAGVALALAAVGIYGTMAYAVGQRTREIGVRMALGADADAVLGLVVRDGVRWTTVGIALGLAGAFGVTRTLERFLYGVTATDTLTLASVTALLFGVALIASYVPARRAADGNPMTTLRDQ